MRTGRSKQELLSRLGLRRILCGLFFVVPVAVGAGAQDVDPKLIRLVASPSVARAPATTGVFTVLALRVEFQPDTTRFTTGDGTFSGDPYGGLEPSVDPMPHDAAFFEAHLAALSHYVRTVSDEQVQVRPILVPEVVRVSGRMGDYTPLGLDAGSDEQISRLSALVSEAWTLADQETEFAVPAELDPERTFYVLFHAGVGRDIELVGTTLDKTPLDIPSIYFDRAALARLGSPPPIFKGLSVTNSVVIPRTETRRGFNFILDEPFLVDLTTNGLLAASFLNFLGVPDLFNTETGESAIGPFGLMDPLGIFAYGGLIPPEPSAWTKVFLGWTSPTEIRDQLPTTVTLRAAATATSDVARVWISDTEYFLVENRYRDVGSDELVMQVWNNGSVTEQRIANGDRGFNGRSIEGFAGGVVVAVDEYDWALPGGLDEEGTPLMGGILIWHVDDQTIRAGLSTNTVNTDPRWRGVDLEEADSGQDLGFVSPGLLGPDLDLGSPFDFFYEGNPSTVITTSGREVRLYENRFGNDTYPDSRTNGGGPSFIEILDFSTPAIEMSARVQRASAESAGRIGPASFRISDAVGKAVLVEDDADIKWCGDAAEPYYALVIGLADEGRYAVVAGDDEGFIRLIDEPEIADGRVACLGGDVLALSVESGRFSILRLNPRTGAADLEPTTVDASVFSAVSPIIVTASGSYIVFASSSGGIILQLDLNGAVRQSVALDSPPRASSWAGEGSLAVAFGDAVQLVDRSGAVVTQWSTESAGVARISRLAFGRDVDGLLGSVVGNSGRVALLLEDGTVRELDTNGSVDPGGEPDAEHVPSLLLEDLDRDGRLDVLVGGSDELRAFTRGGAVVDGFPIEVSSPVSRALTLASTEGGRPTLLVGTESDYVYAHRLDRGRRVAPGYPLPAGPALALHGSRLYSASQSGHVSVWGLTSVGTPRWSESFGSSANQSFVGLEDTDPGDSPGTSLLVASETYNWPNPVGDGRTNFRVATTEDASLRITIVDMAGGKVDELRAPLVRGGAPYEVTWATDAQSGLYVARVTVTSTSGATESRLVKVAIIR